MCTKSESHASSVKKIGKVVKQDKLGVDLLRVSSEPTTLTDSMSLLSTDDAVSMPVIRGRGRKP